MDVREHKRCCATLMCTDVERADWAKAEGVAVWKLHGKARSSGSDCENHVSTGKNPPWESGGFAVAAGDQQCVLRG